MDDPQTGFVDRPVRQFRVRRLRPMYRLVPGGNRYYRRGRKHCDGVGNDGKTWKPLRRIIAEHPFFDGLETYCTNLLVGCASNVRFEAGTYILREGDQANDLLCDSEGQGGHRNFCPQHKPIMWQRWAKGRSWAGRGSCRPYTWRFQARAVEDTRSIALDGKCLRTKCEENHDLGYEVLKRFSQIIEHRLEATRMQCWTSTRSGENHGRYDDNRSDASPALARAASGRGNAGHFYPEACA